MTTKNHEEHNDELAERRTPVLLLVAPKESLGTNQTEKSGTELPNPERSVAREASSQPCSRPTIKICFDNPRPSPETFVLFF